MNTLTTTKDNKRVKVYLAGPEVFFYDAPIVFEKSVSIAKGLGLEPLSPYDAEPSSHIKNDQTHAKQIYFGNIGLIDEADAVVANLNSFRGSEPDSGTVFEVGYAVAKGKRVVGFLDDDAIYRERVKKVMRVFQDHQGRWSDEERRWVEEMGLPLNLMLSCSVELVFGTIEDALKKLKILGMSS
jgi:nucleoside 2-deoxyribosyltransferase